MSLTRINGEPVKLVERFEELREGMVVWVKPCGFCSNSHRGILLGRYSGGAYTPAGHHDVRGEWHAEPPIKCHPHHPGFLVSKNTVRNRRAFRVTDEKLESESKAKSRELERVR